MAQPNVVGALQQKARAALEAGRFEEALAACRNLLSFQPNSPDALAVAGIASLQLGDAKKAVEYLEQAVKRRAEMPVAWLHLGSARKSLGLGDQAVKAYRKALSLKPDLTPAAHNLGALLQEQGKHGEAAQVYRAALDRSPTQAAASTWRNLALALEHTKELEEAREAYRKSIALDPEWVLPRSGLMRLLWNMRDMERLLVTCEAWLKRRPQDTEALAWMALAHAEKGETAKRDALLDFDKLVAFYDLPPPTGWSDNAAFHADMVQHIYAHPTLKVPGADHPTYHHPQLAISEELLDANRGPMTGYEELVRGALERYRNSLPEDHPVRLHWPKKWRLSVWAALLKGEGNLVPHIHIDGYVGGVYYVRLPPVTAREDAEQAAWFELGRPPEELGTTAEPRTRRIQPREGRMILFPSYFYHGTVPFSEGKDRLSVAFDVVPE